MPAFKRNRAYGRNVGVWVRKQQPQKFGAGIPRSPYDSDFYFI
jgi:hypothetical protein